MINNHKILPLIKLFIPVFCFFACSNQATTQDTVADTSSVDSIAKPIIKDSFPKGKIIEHIACSNNASQSYALYIPNTGNETTMPVMYFFDPHGEGALPLKHYTALADAYHFILIGSNNSKNGNDWNKTQTIWNNLFADTKNRLLFNVSRIYTCGFSGGAKVAAYVGLHQREIKGVIASGAGLPDEEPAQNLSFDFTAMAGNGDMNMTDLVALDNELSKTTTKHRLILFDGKHAWPPIDAMRKAFTGLECDAMRNHFIAKKDSLIKAFTEEAEQETETFVNKNQLVQAEQTCALADNILNNLTPDAGWFKNKENVISGDPVYQKQIQQIQALFVAEQKQKQVFQQQFSQGDMTYWTTTIQDLQIKAKAKTPEGAMYQRLLAYLSLAFYSISNQLITGNQNEPAQHFVMLYKMADATNPEAWYFSALLNARNSHSQEAENDLIKAAGYGFTDTSRFLNQPEFQTLTPKINVAFIESKMKKAE